MKAAQKPVQCLAQREYNVQIKRKQLTKKEEESMVKTVKANTVYKHQTLKQTENIVCIIIKYFIIH